MESKIHLILRKALHISLLLLLLIFSGFMIRLTLSYFSFETNVAFLQIKQWVFKEYGGLVSNIWIVAFYIHVFTSLLALIAGFTQFNRKLLNSNVHRVIGGVYIVVILLLTGPSGLIMGLLANGGIFSIIAFTLLSVLWWFNTFMAYRTVKQKQYDRHAKYMFRSYALTLSAITLRLWKFTIVNYIYEIPPMDLYRLVAWLGWVPNLVIAELMIFKGWPQRILNKN